MHHMERLSIKAGHNRIEIGNKANYPKVLFNETR